MRGTVQAVERRPLGAVLATGLAVGDAAVNVVAGTGWDPSGTVTVGGEAMAYTSVEWGDDTGAGYDSLVLAAPSAAAGAAWQSWADGGRVDYRAAVVIDGDDHPTWCVVAHPLRTEAALSQGATAPVTVEVSTRPDGPLVTDAVALDPQVDLAHSAPGSLPAAAVDMADWTSGSTVKDLLSGSDLSGATLDGTQIGADGTITVAASGQLMMASGASIQLGASAVVLGATTILRGSYTDPRDVDQRLTALEAGGGGTVVGGIEIDCGSLGADSGVDIDCGSL